MSYANRLGEFYQIANFRIFSIFFYRNMTKTEIFLC